MQEILESLEKNVSELPKAINERKKLYKDKVYSYPGYLAVIMYSGIRRVTRKISLSILLATGKAEETIELCQSSSGTSLRLSSAAHFHLA